jgi:hypothetical protein
MGVETLKSTTICRDGKKADVSLLTLKVKKHYHKQVRRTSLGEVPIQMRLLILDAPLTFSVWYRLP